MAVETAPAHTPLQPGQRPFHILDTRDFSPEWLVQDLFPLAREMETVANSGGNNDLADKRVLVLFHEPSTRTYISSISAAELLGARVTWEQNATFSSSLAKGEPLKDSMKMYGLNRYHCMVVRHNEAESAAVAASVLKIPVINAGDGPSQHPTQAFLDSLTVHEQFGQIGGLRYAFIGDPNGSRTIHSLTYLAAKFPDVRMDFISPEELRIPSGIREYLKEKGVEYTEDKTLDEVLPDVDVAYITRYQKERHNGSNGSSDYSQGDRRFRIDLEALDRMKPTARVLHPLPRNSELPEEVDVDPRVVIERQVENGLFIRMALFEMILNKDYVAPSLRAAQLTS